MTATKAIRNVAITLAALGLSGGAVALWKRYGRLDPYASMMKKRPADATTSIRADDVKVRQYQGGKLVASAHADALSVNPDRSSVSLHGIKDGVANTSQGAMHFQAKDGTLRPNLRTVDVNGAVQVSGKDAQGKPYLIQTGKAQIDGRKGQVAVPTRLKGLIAGGKFVADELVYRPNTDYAKLRNVAWKGRPPQSAALPVGQKDSAWDIEAAQWEKKGRKVVYTEARAEDGEVIVMAPHVEQDTRTEVIVATGRATYRSAKADLVADKIVVHRKEGFAEFTGNVVMLVRPKKDWDKPLPKNDVGAKPLVPDLPADLKVGGAPPAANISPEEKKRDEELRSGRTLREYPMNLKAAEVTYWYKEGTRHAVAKGGDPTAFQQFDSGRWREAKAIQANYDGEKDTLELLSDGTQRQVRMKNSIGDWTDAIWMRMSTKEDQGEDDDDIQAKSAKAHYVRRDDDEDADLKGGKKTPPPPPTKTGP